MRSWTLKTVCALSLIAFASSAEAGRTAIDSYLDPVTGIRTPIRATVGGYCDFNLEGCSASDAVNLGYSVTIGGSVFTSVFEHGNGLLTFGQPVDFYFETSPVYQSIVNREDPLITDYGRTLVSAGQSNQLDYQTNPVGFLQSATTSVDATTGTITTEFYICGNPTAPGVCPHQNVYYLTLMPTVNGYLGAFDFSTGRAASTDVGYVSGGVFQPTGTSFLLPATFEGLPHLIDCGRGPAARPGRSDRRCTLPRPRGAASEARALLTSAAPEPVTWAMMLVGFGAVGASMRRKGASKVSYTTG